MIYFENIFQGFQRFRMFRASSVSAEVAQIDLRRSEKIKYGSKLPKVFRIDSFIFINFKNIRKTDKGLKDEKFYNLVK